MNAVQPARCLLELRADELEKTRNVCGEHGTTRLAVATQPAQVSRLWAMSEEVRADGSARPSA